MKLTNNHNLPAAIFNAIKNDTYNGPGIDSNKISVTSLINPPRIHYLKKRHWRDIIEDASDALWRLLGQAVHAILERAGSGNNIVEERAERVIDGVTISGQADILDECAIEDYKLTSIWQYIHAQDGKKEHIAQLNLIRWLISPIFPEISRLTVNLILRDWSAGKAKSTPGLPPIPFVSIDVPVWSADEIDAYVSERVSLFKAASKLADNDLPECSSEDCWERPTVFAVMKDGGKKAIPGGLCKTMKEAETLVGPKMHVEVRAGGRMRCAGYCVAAPFCNQYKAYAKKMETVPEVDW